MFEDKANFKDFPQGIKFGPTSARGREEEAHNWNAP